MKREIRAFIGHHGSGKDYQCQQLVNLGNWQKLAFADPLRYIFFRIIGLSDEEGMRRYDELRKTVIFNGRTGQDMIASLGMDGIAHFKPDFLVNCVVDQIRSLGDGINACISDLRMPAEYRALHKLAKNEGWAFSVVLCDYNSKRKDIDASHPTLKMPDYFIQKGYVHMEAIKEADLEDYCQS